METPLRIKTLERLASDYALYSWSCAPLLGNYVYHQRDLIRDKNILELGAGTAIPGLVAAKCGAHVTLTDREDNPILLEYLHQTCVLNGVEGNVNIVGLTWGVFSPVLLNLGPQDIILASDCFYDSKDFEDVLVTVAYIMAKNSCVFWTTYQERSSNRTLLPLLDRWDLHCKVIPIKEEWTSHGIKIEGPTSACLKTGASLQLWEISKRGPLLKL